MEILDKIKAELAVFEEKKKELVNVLQKEFPSLLKPFLNRTEKVKSIGWTQYTPYFNDGEPCEFSVYTDYLIINEDKDSEDRYACEEDPEWYDWRFKYYLLGDKNYANLLEENPELDVEAHKVVEEIKQFLSDIPEDFYLELFGDHVKVTVYEDGKVEVEEYERD